MLAGQEKQEVEPVPENIPPGHEEHGVTPIGENVPGLHADKPSTSGASRAAAKSPAKATERKPGRPIVQQGGAGSEGNADGFRYLRYLYAPTWSRSGVDCSPEHFTRGVAKLAKLLADARHCFSVGAMSLHS